MEDDSRYKLLKELSENKFYSKLLSKSSYSQKDIDELINEGLISIINNVPKEMFPFYRITLKGFLYLKEYNHFLNTTKNERRKNNWFYPLLCITFFLAFVDVYKLYIQLYETPKQEVRILHKNKVLPIHNDTVFVFTNDSLLIN